MLVVNLCLTNNIFEPSLLSSTHFNVWKHFNGSATTQFWVAVNTISGIWDQTFVRLRRAGTCFDRTQKIWLNAGGSISTPCCATREENSEEAVY
jgi:hypothetical protein